MASYRSILKDMLFPSSRPPPTSLWDPNISMPLLLDRIVVLSGPTAGIGYETLRQLILSSAHVYLFGPNPGKMTLIQCDLSSLASIKKAVEEFKQKEDRVDLVFGNAGVMEGGKTEEGYELMWGTNVLGHHALIRLLLPLLKTSAQERNSTVTGGKRVVLTASDTHKWVTKPQHLTLSPNATNAKLAHIHLYGRSKLGNVYTAQRLAKLSTANGWGITVCSVHPGGIQSQLGSGGAVLTKVKNWFLWPATLGAVTQLWGAVGAEGGEVQGKYLVPWAKVGEQSELAKDERLEGDVWRWCEEQLRNLIFYDG
ncbi:uncharacterized protein UDID_01324 [Ustilago sp. UG-2017a]|nr:uncharacterized protein UDID_01324 [Ustilago sp. UG-2017a]